MSPSSVALLSTFWGWVSGVTAVVMIGVAAPVCVGMILGLIPLAIHRRDWRPLPVMVVPALIALAVGGLALATIRGEVPTWDFWTVLGVEIGSLSLGLSAFAFVRMSVKRIRAERAAVRELAMPLPTSAVSPGSPAEPGTRKRLNGIDAEYYVAEWMRCLGASDATVTPARNDGGIDVRSSLYVAQVKHRPGDYVSIETVRALIGAARLERRTPLFFSSGPYSRHVFALAAEADVALFYFIPKEGRLVAANAVAHGLKLRGLGPSALQPR